MSETLRDRVERLRRMAVQQGNDYWARHLDQLLAAPTPDEVGQAEGEACNWQRCHRSPNPCFAWCKCRCHNKSAARAEATR